MRVFFRPGTTVFPKGGRQDGVTYCYQYDGRLCFARNYYEVPMRAQNYHIISVSRLAKQLWDSLAIGFKNQLKRYTLSYVQEYPSFRGKFISSYAIFMKIIHKIEAQFQISKIPNFDFQNWLKLFGSLSIADFIKLGWLKKIKNLYKLNFRYYIIPRRYSMIQSDILSHPFFMNSQFLQLNDHTDIQKE